jgi:hypothetical protein
MQKAGIKVIELINDQVKDYLDEDGKPFIPYSYSYFVKKFRLKSTAKTKGGKSKAEAKFDAAWGAGKNKVNMTRSGNMLSAMSPINPNDESLTAKIGFVNQEAATIAFYHNVSGAGRSRVIRRFFGLSPKSMLILTDYIKNQMGADYDGVIAALVEKLAVKSL